MPDSKTSATAMPPRQKTKSSALARIESDERKWVEAFKLGAIIARSAAAVCIVYFLVGGLKSIVLSKADSIDALARFVEKANIGSTMGYMLAGVMGVAYTRERRGKKRLIGEKGRLQREVEANDPARLSSGLDANGETPDEEE